MGDVRDMNRRFLLDDAALGRLGRLGVSLHHIDALNDHPVGAGQNLQHFTGATLVGPGNYDDLVALLDLAGHGQSTSGAKDTIFMNFLAPNSRVTGPKIRVPIGSPCLLMSTAALRSKRIELPSIRRISLAVRTMTARCTSPFFPRPRGIASLTETMITSPTPAVRRLEPPITLMHWTRRAPELSATSRFVCIWIMRRRL